MDGELRVAAFSTVFDAELMRGYLDSHGIEARLEDDMIVSTALAYATAVGGVKLFVPSSDAERATHLIAEHEASLGADRKRPESPDERAQRAFRTAIVGHFLFPVGAHAFSLYLLSTTPFRGLSGRSFRSATRSALIRSKSAWVSCGRRITSASTARQSSSVSPSV